MDQTIQIYSSLFLKWREAYALQDSAYAWITLLAFFTCAVVGYLLGSVNFGIILSLLRHDDVRLHGSGNAGTTNVLRTYGKGPAIFTLAGDVLKGMAAVYLGMWLFGETGMAVAGFTVIIGHMFPLYFKFKGGKGVAAGIGVAIAVHPIVAAGVILIFALVFFTTRYVSLASVMGAFLYPLLMRAFMQASSRGDSPAIVMAVLTAVMVVFAHRSNLKRLYNREESKTYFNPDKKAAEAERVAAEKEKNSKNK